MSTSLAESKETVLSLIRAREVEIRSLGVERVGLFGSFLRGEQRPDSDIDLLVIARSEEPRHRRAAPIYGALSDILAPMDILVYSPQEGGRMERGVAGFCHHGGPPRNRAV